MKKEALAKVRTGVVFFILWHIARSLPLPAGATLLSWIMRTFSDRFTRQDVIRENLSKAFPDMTARKVKETGKNIAANLGVIAAELSHIDEFCGGIANGKLTYTGEAQLALAKAGPVIFVGPHQWNWEVAPIFYVESGIRVTTIYGKLKNELMNKIILADRQKTGATYVERGNAIRSVMSTLESGGSLCFIIDQRVKSGVQVKFFGRDFLMTSFPARLAIKYHCPIVPIDMERLPGHKFHMIFGTPILPPPIPNSQAEQQMTQAIAEQFERTISRSPETWFCNKRRWPD
jgi:KDO2-lipid IV(A) lauroyltransferase